MPNLVGKTHRRNYDEVFATVFAKTSSWLAHYLGLPCCLSRITILSTITVTFKCSKMLLAYDLSYIPVDAIMALNEIKIKRVNGKESITQKKMHSSCNLAVNPRQVH